MVQRVAMNVCEGGGAPAGEAASTSLVMEEGGGARALDWA